MGVGRGKRNGQANFGFRPVKNRLSGTSRIKDGMLVLKPPYPKDLRGLTVLRTCIGLSKLRVLLEFQLHISYTGHPHARYFSKKLRLVDGRVW